MDRDNDIFVMMVGATLVLLILVFFIVSFILIYQSRQMRHHLELKSVQEKFNQEIFKTQLEIKEQTLKYLSEEIHDNVGQVLSLAVLNLSSLDLTDTDMAAVKIENTTKLVENAVADLRNLSKTMDAENIALVGLMQIIRFELEMIEKSGNYVTTLKQIGEERRLKNHEELILYRIVQESLNNIIKHSKASLINISLEFSTSFICMEITDNGIGINPDKTIITTIEKTGAGLNNMKRRVSLLGGSLNILSNDTSGTIIRIRIPFLS